MSQVPCPDVPGHRIPGRKGTRVPWTPVSADDLAEAKRRLRLDATQRRDALDAADRARWSARIVEHLAGRLGADALVMTFVAIRSELDLGELSHRASGVVLPRVENGRLVAVRYRPGDDLVPSRFGVPEPVGEPIDPSEVDVVCVPGLAFDRAGRRIGYGAGFYDRFLPTLRPGTPTIGVAFGAQMVERVPTGAHDRLVDLVITEEGVAGGAATGDGR